MRTYRCSACGHTLPIEAGTWRCACGGLLDLTPEAGLLDLTGGAGSGDPGSAPVDRLAAVDRPAAVDPTERSLWRYRSVLPFDAEADTWRAVTMGEGMTPLIGRAATSPSPPAGASSGSGTERGDVRLKLDFLMPTLSYKDRGAAVLVAKAVELGVERLVADSSGNAGVAIAAYAARAGIAAEVFVPAATSANKVAQLRGFNATVHQVAGTRTDAAAAAIERVEAGGVFYASHVYNPLFLEGTKTLAYEVWEQLGGRLPGTVVVPAGNGTLLLGAARGFAELVAAGAAGAAGDGPPGRPPRLVAVQAARCDPVAAAWSGRVPDLGDWTTTVAEGIAIPEPPRLAQMVDAVRAGDGTFLTVSEDRILAARTALAAEGLDVEPTAAAVWGAWQAWPGAATTPGPVVIVLTGAGLKAAGGTA